MENKITDIGSIDRKVWYIALVCLCNLSILASEKVNYCSSKMCRHTNAHTFCQYGEGPGRQCTGYIQAPLSNQEKARVLTRLNQRRAAAASGRLKGFPTAGNMLKLLWIDELAREAQLWADQCEPPKIPEENDACRDLYAVTVGQCVASVLGEAPGLKPETMVDMWYMQSRHYSGNVTFYENPQGQFGFYGDFAQLVYAKAYMVGCGRSRFMITQQGRLRSVERLVCNFAPRGPFLGRSIWTVASPATACPPRSQPDDTFPALCSIRRDLDESQDQDNLMSIEEHILLDTLFDIDKNESLNYLGSIDELYLTKIAIATMSNFATIHTESTTFLNTDIMDDDDLTATDILSSTIEQDNGVIPVPAIRASTEKVKLIGRPKSYNMEELTYLTLDSKTENPDLQLEDLPNTATTLDIDYEYVEPNQEVKLARQSVIEPFKGNVTFPTTTANTNETEANYGFTERNDLTEENASSEEVVIIQTSPSDSYNNNISLSVNETDAIIDEYLNDPETFRQLQEELQKMERTISTQMSSTERSEKVRRDLRNRSVDQSEGPNETVDSTTSHIQQLVDMLSEEEKNRTVDKPAMFNVVMKYMPLLKDYKNGFFKRAVGNNAPIISLCRSILVLTILFNVL